MIARFAAPLQHDVRVLWAKLAGGPGGREGGTGLDRRHSCLAPDRFFGRTMRLSGVLMAVKSELGMMFWSLRNSEPRIDLFSSLLYLA
ncbi:hypothetical protein AXG93_4368s1800 [Marchantia polymorpha subsp. ruderalis]|uniref:Uncharacterized protein n=1 Tax=Marchantia polymorpha subsp. ruderalis TaxID=1480154 RepID=A0A176VY35_MARPO|nr:hypothetical protein AXG93_4368s1800 [Marchantia polymorpha subsp. ruderalis]